MGIRVWITFDLGVRGDYDGLYKWLDEQKALECVDSTATFFWDYSENMKTEIKESLQNSVEFKKTDRIYLIFQKPDNGYTGSFIIGKRKASRWEGYSVESTEDDE